MELAQPTSTSTPWFIQKQVPTRTFTAFPTTVRHSPKHQTPTPTPTISSFVLQVPGEETISFDEPPVNLWVNFKDGMGKYRLDVIDKKGENIKTLLDQTVITQKETWTAWDGTNGNGRLMPKDLYYAVLFKDGKALRKIVLKWNVH
jgi:hypothetical protein